MKKSTTKMKSFKEFFEFKTPQILDEAGQDVGKIELVKTDLADARSWAENQMKSYGNDLNVELPNFDANYEKAKLGASGGKTKRKDMPVIDEKDVKDFQDRLKSGYLDIFAPFAKRTKSVDKFPKGMNKSSGQDWLQNGAKNNDGEINDDQISVKSKKIPVGKLKPIQQQIYFDKSMDSIAKNGAAASKKFIGGNGTTFIVSADNYIIDGHHRYLAGNLIDPNMKVNATVIDLPIAQLLPASLSYSDAVGNKRNA